MQKNKVMKKKNTKKFSLRKITDAIWKNIFRISGFLAASLVIIIFLFILQKGISVFLSSYGEQQVNFWSFISGRSWKASEGIYGVFFIIVNTLLVSFFAVLIAFPLSVLTALFIAKIANKRVSKILISVIEVLAAIPSVVYGLFASTAIVGLVSWLGELFGISTYGGNSTLAVILLLAIMILPTITSLSITAIKAVNQDLINGSLALGASKMQTYFKVVLSSAKSGIIAGLVLGLSRAFGEATAVSLVAGNKIFGPSFSFFDITRTLTSTMLSGIHETVGVDYDVRFSVGVVLMIIILLTNLIIQYLKKKIGNTL